MPKYSSSALDHVKFFLAETVKQFRYTNSLGEPFGKENWQSLCNDGPSVRMQEYQHCSYGLLKFSIDNFCHIANIPAGEIQPFASSRSALLKKTIFKKL